jgi:type II secretory pathway component PulF
MLTFVYTAHKNDTGQIIKAEVQAENERSAAKLLMSQGLFPISIDNKEKAGLLGKSGLTNRVGTKDRVIFTRQLSTLINAGLPLTQSLRTVQDQINNKRLREVVAEVVSSVESGVSLADSFGKHPEIFNNIYVSLVAAAVFGGRSWSKTEKGRAAIDQFKLVVPLFGKIYRKVYMARFARTLGTLLGSGIPMLEALRIVKDAIGNVHVADALDKSISGVKGGKALSSTLEGQETFIRLVPQMIKIGEQSGAIDSMLDRVATYFENEVDEEVKNLSTTMEPLLMVVLGVLVGGVIAAILLPVYSLVGSGSIDSLK